ncbi:biopolymer transporter ExbD [Hydrogenimonas cancrithermarum]|uniref:Biopolymer transport protein ExbD-like 1 n=1 Tax=Hydrogenimonas cancrithermarum TaxID=2993563 RepID=A0ABN6WVW7_9BACT|nr:biopolymer transporter ExbD [Hydrogenimonas cancrithermarum]BDY12337.1 putative biopolymer transport protein ExbD-like 1 [Hydrogenimonas cancrithermarum]
MRYQWDENPDLNITPLVDIMLVLMAILMVTAPTIIYEENITLPQGSRTKTFEKVKSLEIRMDKKGIIYFQKEKYEKLAFPDRFLLKTQSLDKKIPVYIRADERLPYKDVMFLLKTVKEAGFSKVSLVTNG